MAAGATTVVAAILATSAAVFATLEPDSNGAGATLSASSIPSKIAPISCLRIMSAVVWRKPSGVSSCFEILAASCNVTP